MKIFLVFILCFAISCSSKNYQTKSGDKKAPKFCERDCLIQDLFETEVLEYPVFTGVYKSSLKTLEKKILTIKPAHTIWNRLLTDNCNDENETDCIEWGSVQVPAQKSEYIILKDTLASKEFKMKSIFIEKIVRRGGFKEKREIVCPSRLDSILIQHIKEALSLKGYNLGERGPDQVRNLDVKDIMIDFQIDKKMPLGHFDLETLGSLGVSF